MALKLDIQSEQFPPTGGIGGEGATRALGRPHLSRLEVLVRESIQNSLDARSSAKEQVHFSIGYSELDARAVRCLRDVVFAEMPDEAELPLASVLSNDALEVLFISDRGTRGLQGPTRTDRLQSEDDPRNFIDFFRNVGRFGDQPTGGGTYGFGKASLYVASAARTIVVHTRIATSQGTKSRLMASALGSQFTRRQTPRARLLPYTGRHWWGVQAQDEVVDPVEGAEADRIASRLGFPPFEDGQTGTSIMVVAPDLDVESNGTTRTRLESAALRFSLASRMRQVLMWYCWPHMIAPPSSRLLWQVSVDGQEIQGPGVDDHPLLRAYAGTYRALTNGNRSVGPSSALKIVDAVCGRPFQHLGRLGLARTFARGIDAEREPDDGGGKTLESIPDGTPRHVALMRAPRLVVRYEEFTAPTDAGFVGVFLADEDLNGAFAESEPVTHDEWNSNSMRKGHARTFVKVALTRISESVREYLAPASTLDEATEGSGEVGIVSRALASLIPSAAGPGAEAQHVGLVWGSQPPDPRGEPAGRGRSGKGVELHPREGSAELTGSPSLSIEDGETVATFQVKFKSPPGRRPFTLRCEPKVLTADGGTERETPEGEMMPAVKYWVGDAIRSFESDGTAELEPATSGFVWVSVLMPENAAVSVDVSVVRASQGGKL